MITWTSDFLDFFPPFLSNTWQIKILFLTQTKFPTKWNQSKLKISITSKISKITKNIQVTSKLQGTSQFSFLSFMNL